MAALLPTGGGRPPPLRMLRHINPGSVLIGMAVGLMLDVLSGTLLTLLLGGPAIHRELSQAQMQQALHELSRTTPFLLGTLVLGSLSTVVAGFVCAWKARRLPYLHSAVVGVVGLLLGALLADGGLPGWFNALAFLSILPTALVGGHLAKQRLG